MNDLERRREALEATASKYRGKALDFRTADCVRMVRYHLLQMGHKPPALPRYRSLTGALRAMKAVGGLVTAFDAILPRIAPAMMLDGDIAVVAGDGGDAAMIRCGYKFMGWHQDHDEAVNLMVDLGDITAAWRA